MRRLPLLAIAVLLAVAGCTAPISNPTDPVAGDDELGVVAGYAANETLDVNASDGLTESELEAVKYRSMARIEVIRGLQFTQDVELEIIGRDEYRERRSSGDDPAHPFTNELWRGAFVVDDETDVNDALDELYGGSIQGYYRDGSIVVVTDDADDVRLSRTTLVHELVHALQDQQFGLGRQGETLDERRAESGLIEGEANYLPDLYDRRCGDEWQCLADPEPEVREPTGRPFNAGLFVSIYAPYSEGPRFVERRHEAGGWDAIDDAFQERPVSTEQLIHPERYPGVRPADVRIEDRSSAGWEPFTGEDDSARTETIGEATLFAMLWYNGAIDRPLAEGGTERSPYNYSHPATDGWAGDSFVAYHDGDRTGHVWELAWKTGEDAEAFRDAYLAVLDERGAEEVDVTGVEGEVDDGVYRVPDDRSFAGAYRVTLDGDRVVIVGAPTVDELEDIRSRERSETVGSVGEVGTVDSVGSIGSVDSIVSARASPESVASTRAAADG